MFKQFIMNKTLINVAFLIFICSCNNKKSEQNCGIAQQLYSQGMQILSDSISIQSTDRQKANKLNIKAIEKFSKAYEADTTYNDSILFASECTMFEKNYKNCIYWTYKLSNIDTTQNNIRFCNDRIAYCKNQIILENKK